MSGSTLLPSVPPDFQRALKQGRLHGFFLQCAYVHRAGYLSWILTSVRSETRRRRIAQAVSQLQAQRTEVLAAARRAAVVRFCRPPLPSPRAADREERQSA